MITGLVFRCENKCVNMKELNSIKLQSKLIKFQSKESKKLPNFLYWSRPF